MQTPRHRSDRGPAVRLALAALKGAALCGLLTLVVVHETAGNPSTAPGTSAAAPQADAQQRVVERAVAEHHCSYDGFGTEQVPGSALIRTTAGEVRQVSFDVGWDVYNGSRPGTLIAVCLDPADDAALVSR